MDSPVSNISALHGITIRWLHNYSGSTHYPKENSIWIMCMTNYKPDI